MQSSRPGPGEISAGPAHSAVGWTAEEPRAQRQLRVRHGRLGIDRVGSAAGLVWHAQRPVRQVGLDHRGRRPDEPEDRADAREHAGRVQRLSAHAALADQGPAGGQRRLDHREAGPTLHVLGGHESRRSGHARPAGRAAIPRGAHRQAREADAPNGSATRWSSRRETEAVYVLAGPDLGKSQDNPDPPARATVWLDAVQLVPSDAKARSPRVSRSSSA